MTNEYFRPRLLYSVLRNSTWRMSDLTKKETARERESENSENGKFAHSKYTCALKMATPLEMLTLHASKMPICSFMQMTRSQEVLDLRPQIISASFGFQPKLRIDFNFHSPYFQVGFVESTYRKVSFRNFFLLFNKLVCFMDEA